jgi:hypothetical protein
MALHFFRRPEYRSDTTQFIDQLKVNKPVLEAEQRQGRELLWDKQVNRSEQQDMQAGRVAQKPYVYQTLA